MSKKLKNYKVIVAGQREEKIMSFVEPVEYRLPAESKEKALKIATKRFSKENPGTVEIMAAAINKKFNIVSIVCLAIACFWSLLPYHFKGGSIFSLSPTLISMLISVALYSSVIIRIKGLKNSFNSVSESIGNVLTIVLIASFVSLLSGVVTIAVDIPIPKVTIIGIVTETRRFNIPISGYPILLGAIMLSWIGMAKIAKYVWIGVFVLAIIRILAANAVMGKWGVFYVLFAFLGIIFKLKQENDELLNKVGHEFITNAAKIRDIVKIENKTEN